MVSGPAPLGEERGAAFQRVVPVEQMLLNHRGRSAAPVEATALMTNSLGRDCRQLSAQSAAMHGQDLPFGLDVLRIADGGEATTDVPAEQRRNAFADAERDDLSRRNRSHGIGDLRGRDVAVAAVEVPWRGEAARRLQRSAKSRAVLTRDSLRTLKNDRFSAQRRERGSRPYSEME